MALINGRGTDAAKRVKIEVAKQVGGTPDRRPVKGKK